MVALFGNSLYYMRLFDKSLRTFEAAQDAVLEEQLQQADRSAGFAEVRKGESDARGGPLCGFLYSEIDGRFPLQGRRKMPQSVM